jgi:hypothetical protein
VERESSVGLQTFGFPRLGSPRQILSPRTLHWTPTQLLWSCRSTTRSDEDPAEAQIKGLVGSHPAKVTLSREQLEIMRQDILKRDNNSSRLVYDLLQI